MDSSWLEIISEVAHDLKSPITSARGFVELMAQCGDPLSDRQERYAAYTLEALDHMEQLVARLLEAAWIEEGRPLKLHPCDLEEVILSAMLATQDFADRHQVTMYADIDRKLTSVLADERRLEQVMRNLLNNAVKYNRPGGNIWVTAAEIPTGVEIAVRDDGRGISADDLPHIFERFYRASLPAGAEQVEGTGLGLAIVKALVEKHGGSVRVESSTDVGTTFFIALPREHQHYHDPTYEREPTLHATEHHDSVDTQARVSSDELLDSVDDNLQEPPQNFIDSDGHDLTQPV